MSRTFNVEPLESRRLFDAGFLDTQFNNTGTSISDFKGVRESARAVLPQADGRVIVVGDYRAADNATNDWDGYVLLRHNSDGTLDPTFGQGGATRLRGPSGLDIQVADAVLQPDGKILVLGSGLRLGPSSNTPVGLVVARFNADGAFDTTFGTGGVLESNRIQTRVFPGGPERTGGLQLLPNGQILVGGVVIPALNQTQIATARLNANGTFDQSYGTLGVSTLVTLASTIIPIALLRDPADGASLVVAQQLNDNNVFVGRFLANGTPDDSFGGADPGLVVLTNFAVHVTDAALTLTGGDVILVGFAAGGNPGIGNVFRVARLANGEALDLPFGGDGDNNGFVDVAFSGEAIPSSAVVQSDGKIVVAGQRTRRDLHPDDRRFALTRLNLDGSIDGTWGEFGKTAVLMGTGTLDEAFDVAVAADGSVYAVGSSVEVTGTSFGGSRVAVARFWRNEAPHALANPRTVNKPGATGINFSVLYRDDGAVNQATFNNHDIQVFDPDGVTTYKVRLLGFVPISGTAAWVANYRVAAPGGTFDAADNGVYRLRLRSNQIADTEGNLAIGRTLGTITVNIAAASSPVMAGFSSTPIRSLLDGAADEEDDAADEELVA